MTPDRIIIPGRLVGLNEYTRACRSHWSRGSRLKRQQTELVAWYARAAGARGHEGPVEVTCEWHERDARRDLDNVAFAAKFVLDGLVMAKVIAGDDQAHVTGIRHVFAVCPDWPRVVVEVRDAIGGEGR